MKRLLLLLSACTLFMLRASAQLANPGFELQDTMGFLPAYWGPTSYIIFPLDSNCLHLGADSIHFSTRDAHSGNYALEMRTASYCGNAYTGNIRAVRFPVDSFVDQRVLFTQRPAAFSFYYKLLSVLGDGALVMVEIENQNGIVADASVKISQAAANWTIGTIPLTYYNTEVPQFLTIRFILHNDTALHYGTRFVVDDIDLTGKSSIGNLTPNKYNNLYCFPVPAQDQLFIKMDGQYGKNEVAVTVTDAMGRLVKNEKAFITGNQIKLDVKELTQGIYFITVTTDKTIATGKFIK